MQSNANRQAAYSRLFSAAVFREMAAKGRSALFARSIKQSLVPDGLGSCGKVSDAFDAALNQLQAVECRDEYVYKAALTNKVLLGKHSLRTASMLTEFRVEDCKADLAILNGTATVYEIKSERDSLARLSKQLLAYRKVFASVFVIAGEKHVPSVLDMIPEDVGVLQLSSRHQIKTIRSAIDSPWRLCPVTVLGSIRTDEAVKILSLLGIDAPSVPNTRMRVELEKHFSRIKPEDLHCALVTTLKKTRDLSRFGDWVNLLPKSLQAAALSMPLRKGEQQNLVSAVNTPLDEAVFWG